MPASLKKLLAMALVFALVGCAAPRPRIDCERHLEPINAPAVGREAGSAHP